MMTPSHLSTSPGPVAPVLSSAPQHRVVDPRILYFGTPVVLLSTRNDDGSDNLAANSSAWALGRTVVIGVAADSQTAVNIARRPDIVINLPTPALWRSVEQLGSLTGGSPVPESKRSGTRYVADKFAAVGLTPVPSHEVGPARVAQCPLQLEARATSVTVRDTGYVIVEAAVVVVHARPDIVFRDTHHIDPMAWTPLIYNFRHYFGLGHHYGAGATSETAAGER